MGAADFTQAQWAPDVDQAFRVARERAQYEHGHGGYSGTLAEKDSYVFVALPPRFTFAKLEQLMGMCEETTWLAYAREDLSNAEAALKRAKPGTIRNHQAWVRRAKASVKEGEKAQAKFARAAGDHAALVRRCHSVAHGDKWGPALALEITGSEIKRWSFAGSKPKRGHRLYVFTGLASS